MKFNNLFTLKKVKLALVSMILWFSVVPASTGNNNDQYADLIEKDQSQNYVGHANNELVFLNKIRETKEEPINMKFLQDSILETPNLCYLYNYAINHVQTPNDSLISFYSWDRRQARTDKPEKTA